MRWKKEMGRIRDRSKFLWWPKCIKGETRWLERATWEEHWIVAGSTEFDSYGYWKATKWVNL